MRASAHAITAQAQRRCHHVEDDAIYMPMPTRELLPPSPPPATETPHLLARHASLSSVMLRVLMLRPPRLLDSPPPATRHAERLAFARLHCAFSCFSACRLPSCRLLACRRLSSFLCLFSAIWSCLCSSAAMSFFHLPPFIFAPYFFFFLRAAPFTRVAPFVERLLSRRYGHAAARQRRRDAYVASVCCRYARADVCRCRYATRDGARCAIGVFYAAGALLVRSLPPAVLMLLSASFDFLPYFRRRRFAYDAFCCYARERARHVVTLF